MKRCISTILSLAIALSSISSAVFATGPAMVADPPAPPEIVAEPSAAETAEAAAAGLNNGFDPEEYVWRQLNETDRFIVKSGVPIVAGDALGGPHLYREQASLYKL